VLGSLLGAPECDAVLACVGSSAMFHPQLAVEPILAAPRAEKPLAAFLTPQAERSLALLAANGIAAFRTPEACADALGAYFSWRTPRPAMHGAAPEWPEAVPRHGRLNEAQALALFAALGVPVVEHRIAQPPGFAHELAYPVAAKVLSGRLAHKTESGAVALGIQDRAEFDARVREMLAAAAALPVQGILVERMEAGLGEAIVGYRDDPLFGPLALVGAGGVLAEIYNDCVTRLAPVSEAEAAEMVAAVKGFAPLRGFRGLPPGDLEALARALAALSRLAFAEGRPVLEAEANPVIVKRNGAVAVDALVRLKGGEE
jgi:acyl-CoA synthetase (NDP forming)